MIKTALKYSGYNYERTYLNFGLLSIILNNMETNNYKILNIKKWFILAIVLGLIIGSINYVIIYLRNYAPKTYLSFSDYNLLLLILSLLGAIGLGTIYLVLNLLNQNKKKNVIISVLLEAIYITFGVLSFLYSREYVDPLNYAYAICFYIGQSLTSISLLFSPYLISVYLLNRKSEETD